MTPARDRLRKAIAEANPRDTEVPVVSNVDAAPHDKGDEWSSLLSAQLSSPVGGSTASSRSQRLGRHAVRRARARWRVLPGHDESGPVDRRRRLYVATPEDLDKLARLAVRGRSDDAQMQIEGELLSSVEAARSSARALAVSNRRTRFADGCTIGVGTVIGHIGSTEVRSPFAGVLQSYIAVEGERVTHRQPIAWLRTV
jgi:[acyl-carrier-protein] S-malonyltransferase